MRVFHHGRIKLVVSACVSVFSAGAYGQSSAVVPVPMVSGTPDLNSNSQPALTPAEKRQKEIDKYDPLSRTNPASPVVVGQPAAATDPQTVDAPASPGRNDRNTAKPLPGSVAESNLPEPTRQGHEPEVVTDGDAAADLTFSGPAVLSRSYTLERPMAARDTRWSWTLSSTEGYQTGLVTGNPSTGTSSTNGNSFFYTTSVAFSGRHFWKRDELGLSYNLTYSAYTERPGYNGVGQYMVTDYTHEFSRRLSLHLVNTGSISPPSGTLQNPLMAPGVSVANISLSASPSLQLLDIRTRQFQTNPYLTWQKSARLSFSMGGGFFAVDRSGLGLTGNIGYQAQADVNYRYDSRTTIGAAYSYTNYMFSQHQSVSDAHTVDLIFSHAFGPTTQLRLRAGVSHIESLGYVVVPIDPAFAVLIGRSSTIVDNYHQTTTSDISAQFVKDFKRKRTASLSFARGISPGNGLILTAIQETASGTFTTLMYRRYSVSFTAGRTALSSQSQNTGGYISEFASVGVTRTIRENLASNFSAQYSSYSITNLPGLRDQFTISTGLSWGPGPGRLW